MSRLVTAALVIASATSTPAVACMRIASPGAITAALEASEGRFSAADIAKVKELRQQTSQFLDLRQYSEAQSAQDQAMKIMGMTFISKGPPARGCGSGEWVRKGE